MLVLQSAAVGGMETHCIDLAAEYTRRGIAVKAIIPEGSKFDELEYRFHQAGALVERLDTDAREGRSVQVRNWLRLLRINRDFAPDVVHLHTPGATGGLAAVVTARLYSRATVVVTEHDVPVGRPARWNLLARLCMDRLGHGLVAVSRRNGAIRSERLGSAPRHFAAVLNGVPLPAVALEDQRTNRARIRQELGIGPRAVVLGSLVRLDRGKGLDDLLRAFGRVLSERECELLLVGDGPLRGELEQLCEELGISHHVRFAGHHPLPAAFLDAMDIFVLPVPAGSMSIALLEAMGRGLPPVITFCGPEEAVIPDETGLGAPPSDPDGLARVLLRIVEDDPLRIGLGQAAAAHVRRHFSVRRVADDLLTVYATVGGPAELPERLRADGPPNARPGDR